MSNLTSDRNRQPKGIPVGGQFSTSAKAESNVGLSPFEVIAETTIVFGDEDEYPFALTPGESSESCLDAGLNCSYDKRDTDPRCGECGAPINGLDDSDLDAEMEHRRAEQAKWGTVAVTEGSRTPWGAADNVEHPAPGIAAVSTPGHGGIKLSKERNAAIPAALRNSSGWYEEDCESYIVGMHHPEAFPHLLKSRTTEESAAYFEDGVKNWYPDAYTKATGREIAVGESSVLQARAKQQSKEDFRAAHGGEFVTLGSGDIHAPWIPKGYAVCEARMDATGEKRTFLMPHDEVVHDGSYGVHALVDPNRHLDVTDVANQTPDRPWVYQEGPVEPIRGEDIGVSLDHLTPAQADRAASELNKVWRFVGDDGQFVTESLGEHMSRVGVVGKRPTMDGDKVTYSVNYPGSRVTKVSKATYDALAGVPDTSSDTSKAYVAKERARVAYERERAKMDFSSGGSAKRKAAEEKYQSAADTYRTLSDAESERARAWQTERDQMQTEAFASLVTDKGLDFGAGD